MELMAVVTVLVVLVVLGTEVETVTREGADICYYQPYYKQLTCSCPDHNTSYLGLNMNHYVRTLGQEVSSKTRAK